LIDVSIGALLKATISHQEAHDVLKDGWALRAVSDKDKLISYGKIQHRSTKSLM